MQRRTFLAIASGSAVLLPASRLLAAGHGRLGAFEGVGDYTASGTAEIAGDAVNLLEDFRFGGAPDPQVGLGRGGFDPATLMGPLASDDGASSYAVPDGVDASGYDEVWIWCRRFDVPLAVARLG